MPTRYITRRSTVAGPALPHAAPIYIDSDDNIVKVIPAGSGTTEVQLLDASSTQTMTNKTLTSPTITGATATTTTLTAPVINGAVTGTALQTKFCTTQFDATSGDTSTTLTNVVGLTGFTMAAGGVYQFEVNLAGTSNASGGFKVAFKYTTTTLTDIESTGAGFTAAAVAVQHTTTTTDQTSLFAATAAYIHVRITGRITVATGGTLAVQAAQNASNAGATSVYVGSYARFRQIS